MRSKNATRENTETNFAVQEVLKERLAKDFCASLAARIIEHNVKKYHIRIKNNDELAKLIKGILSDYEAINPVGYASSTGLKKDLQDALKRSVD